MLECVDSKYNKYLKLWMFLLRLKVVGIKKHSFYGFNYTSEPQPHWIPLSVISITKDFIEFVPYKEREEGWPNF